VCTKGRLALASPQSRVEKKLRIAQQSPGRGSRVEGVYVHSERIRPRIPRADRALRIVALFLGAFDRSEFF
jgi:hypothetical protein